jgi:HAD superfamily hydrolase (TIGR01458 family)
LERPPGLLAVTGCLVDVDGVLRVDDWLIPGAAAAIATLRARGFVLRFVTNTSVRSRASLRENLQSLGLSIGDDELFTAPVATAAYLRARGYRRLFLLVKGDVVDDFADFDLVSSNVEAVVIGGAEEGFTYDAINRAFRLLLDGAELVAIHRNLAWQTLQGLQIDAGAYVAALEAASGVKATLVGKPAARIFEEALESLSLPATSAVVVGDDIGSDIRGGQQIGARTVLVRTGKFRPGDLERSDLHPDLVIDSIADLPNYLVLAGG